MMLLSALGGGAGALSRFLLDTRLAAQHWPTMKRLLLINVVGSVALGIIVALASEPWLALLGTGFCGGFTTFSTAMVTFAEHSRRKDLSYLIAMSALALAGYFAAVHVTTMALGA